MTDATNKSLGKNPKDLLGTMKVDMSVLPPAAEIYMALAMMDGKRKYGSFNWRENEVIASIYYAAMRRHMLAWMDGQNNDPNSGVPHLGHAMACLAILADAMETGNLIDDRPPPGEAANLIEKCTKDIKP